MKKLFGFILGSIIDEDKINFLLRVFQPVKRFQKTRQIFLLVQERSNYDDGIFAARLRISGG